MRAHPTFDPYFWSFNLPHFLDFLPSPGEPTLDIGCGEGRLARELTKAGHTVLGIDGSPTLARLASQAEFVTSTVCFV